MCGRMNCKNFLGTVHYSMHREKQKKKKEQDSVKKTDREKPIDFDMMWQMKPLEIFIEQLIYTVYICFIDSLSSKCSNFTLFFVIDLIERIKSSLACARLKIEVYYFQTL